VAAEQLSEVSDRPNLGFDTLALRVDGGEPDAEIGKLRRDDLPLRQQISAGTGLLRRQIHGALGAATPGRFLDRAVDLADSAVEIGDNRGLVLDLLGDRRGAALDVDLSGQLAPKVRLSEVAVATHGVEPHQRDCHGEDCPAERCERGRP